jgi:hypothetical protein
MLIQIVPYSFSVAVLNPEFLQLPVQAIECTLANLPSSEKRKNKFVDKFLEMVNGKELVCRLEEQDINGKYAVLIIDTVDGHTININEKMAEFIANAGKQPGKGMIKIELVQHELRITIAFTFHY